MMRVSWTSHVMPAARDALARQLNKVAASFSVEEVTRLLVALSRTGLRFFELPDEVRQAVRTTLERLEDGDGELLVPLLGALGRLEAHWSHDFSPRQRQTLLAQLERLVPSLRSDDLGQLIYG